jgi:methyl-accepting chemotaxis protein
MRDCSGQNPLILPQYRIFNRAERTAEGSSNAAGATEEQTAALPEMTDSASSLTTKADTLRQTLERFETSARDHPQVPDEPSAGSEDD